LTKINPMTASDEEVEREVERHARRETRWAWLIVAALVFETGVLWAYRRDNLEAILFIIADIGIAAGVAGEIRSGRRAGMWAGELNRRSKERVAEANRKAKEARLEFERYRAPRILRPEQIDRIAEELRQFSGSQFVTGVNLAQPEMVDLVEYIEMALARAGWIQLDVGYPGIPRRGKPHIGLGVKNAGVLIGLLSEAPPEEVAPLITAGKALAAALTTEGIETPFDFTQEAPLGVDASAIINVLVGPQK
jgi:hypothetical protein